MYASDLGSTPRSAPASNRYLELMKTVTITDSRVSTLILRVALGVMILPHGFQKTFGLFGGHGFTGTMQYFTETMGIPYVLGLLAIIAELAGGLGLIFGLGTRIAALGVGTVMLVSAFTSHIEYGFFMNWFGNQKGEGIEFHLLALAMSASLILSGGGQLSIDQLIARRTNRN